MKQQDKLKNEAIKSMSHIMNAYQHAHNKVNSLNTKAEKEFLYEKF